MIQSIIERQAAYDPKHFNREDWKQPSWRDEKTRHIHLHVGKAGLKLATFNHTLITREVAPDLTTAAAQLALLFDFPPDTLDAESPGSTTRVDQLFGPYMRAQGYLAGYLEPQEHGATGDRELVLQAAQGLYGVASNIAEFYRFDLNERHEERLSYLATVR